MEDEAKFHNSAYAAFGHLIEKYTVVRCRTAKLAHPIHKSRKFPFRASIQFLYSSSCYCFTLRQE